MSPEPERQGARNRSRVRLRPPLPGPGGGEAGISPPTDVPRPTVDEVLAQLYTCYSTKVESGINEESRAAQADAIISTLRLHPWDRHDNDIHVIAIGEPNDRNKVQTTFPWQRYAVYVIFPFRSRIANAFLTVNNDDIQQRLPQRTHVDKFVNNNADEIQPETLADKQRRFIFEIKELDNALYRQMHSHQRDEQKIRKLLMWKQRRIVGFLLNSIDLESRYSELGRYGRLFRLIDEPNGETKLAMRRVTDPKRVDAILNPHIGTTLSVAPKEFKTGIKKSILFADYEAYLADPVTASEPVRVSVAICGLLHIHPEGTRRLSRPADFAREVLQRTPSTGKSSQSEAKTAYIPPAESAVTVYSAPPVEGKEPLSKAARRRLAKQQQKKPHKEQTITELP